MMIIKQIFTIAILCLLSIQAKAQYHIKTVKVDSNIYLYTSYGDVGEYKNIDANAVVVVSGNDALLFDTPWDKAQTEELIHWVKDSLRKNIIGCIITHAHVDRIGGIDVMHQNKIPTYAYHLSKQEAIRNKHTLPQHLFYDQDTTFRCGDMDIIAYYPGAGHTVDNIVLYLPSKQFLYGGCFIKSGYSKSIGNIADANVQAWPISLSNVEKHFQDNGINMVIPGHGSWESSDAFKTTRQLLKEHNHTK